MLHPAHGTNVAFEPTQHQQGWLVLRVDDRRHRVRRIGKAQYRAMRKWSDTCPQRIGVLAGLSLWLYRGDLYGGETRLSLRDVERQLVAHVA